MRILFLHEVNYLTKPIFEMHEFPEHLAGLGHEVGFVHFPEGYSKSQIAGLGWRKRIPGRVVDGAELDLFTPWALGGGLLGRLFTATVSYWQFKNVLRVYRPEVVVSFSVPTSGWQALMACRRAGVPFVFRALDVSHKIRKGAFSPLVKLAERFIYREAALISANNEAMVSYCMNLAKGRLAPSVVNYPPLNLNMFANGNRAEGRERLGLEGNQPAIIYLGSFFYFSGLAEVIKSFSGLQTNAKLILIGGGEQDAMLRKLVEELGMSDRVIFTGFVSFDELPSLICASDIAINPMEKSVVSDAALPNKVLQYLASGVECVSTPLEGLQITFSGLQGLHWAQTQEGVISRAVDLTRLGSKADLSKTREFLISMESKSIGEFERALQGVLE